MKIRILDIGEEDSYFKDSEQLIGKTGELREQTSHEDDGFVAADIHFDEEILTEGVLDKDFFFWKVKFEEVV